MVGGLDSLAKDPTFVSVAKQEMAEAMHMPVTDMEGVAQGILNGRSGRVTAVKRKRRPIPTPPSVPASTQQERAHADTSV